MLAENVAYLVDDDRRREALRELRRLVGIEPEQILAASDDVLLQVVAGMQPTARVARLRRCAELAIAEAPWTRFPGIGKPGAERIVSRFQRTRTWKTSTDPEYDAKLDRIEQVTGPPA